MLENRSKLSLDVCAEIFRSILGRDPENLDVLNNISMLSSFEAVIVSLINSPEYFEKSKRGPSSADCAQLFQAILGRTPENANAIDLLRSLPTLHSVAATLINSPEFRSKNSQSHNTENLKLASSLALSQIIPWMKWRSSIDDWRNKLISLSKEIFHLFIFEILDGEVTFSAKNDVAAQLQSAGYPAEEFIRRATFYKNMLSEVVYVYNIRGRIVIPIDVNDEAQEYKIGPIFSFQKRQGERNPLLVDFELISLNFLESVEDDHFCYDQKTVQASFAGSTSGKNNITLKDITSDSIPRIRAARYFEYHKHVDFRLPYIVQCAAPDVEQQLREWGFGINPLSWPDAYRSRFLISIDGNGAACSRPEIILKSRSALVKYSSEHVLFYTPVLIPWLHYIPVDTDRQVLEIIEVEQSAPGTFSMVAEAGGSFASDILSRNFSLNYTAEILRMYQKLFV